MWPSRQPVNLIRYLFAWRVNGSLVRIPKHFSVELSRALGSRIAARVPPHEARQWQKALAPWDEYLSGGSSGRKPRQIPDVAWPIEAALFAYPHKRTYGAGELILWELKLLGGAADHGLFLEVILPAIEEASYTSDPEQPRGSIWGKFDVYAVYVARGFGWEPLVADGRLDLRYRATPTQWTEGLAYDLDIVRPFRVLDWLMPFDLTDATTDPGRANPPGPRDGGMGDRAPGLRTIVEALLRRVSQLMPGKRNEPDCVWEHLDAGEQASLTEVLEQAGEIAVIHEEVRPTPKGEPGRWIGEQAFSSIPPAIIPYLDLASILHIGRQTHFGCGTLKLS